MANIEITIARLVSKDKRNRKRVKGSLRSKKGLKGSNNKDKQISKVIEKIKQMQREREIKAFTRKFLRDMLREHTNLSDRVIRKKIVELLKHAKKKEGIMPKKFLINTKHFEKKLRGELTTTPVCPIERIWIEKNKMIMFYSFL